jgi:hypothetical protein
MEGKKNGGGKYRIRKRRNGEGRGKEIDKRGNGMYERNEETEAGLKK